MAVVLSSRTRLRIADLISVRPRTLGELASLTGISIQGVLKQLQRLERLGLVEEKKVTGSGISVHKVYRGKGVRLGDFSVGDLTVVKLTKSAPQSSQSSKPLDELEFLAEEALLQRRRIKDHAKKLGRMIDDLVEDEAKMSGLLDSMDLGDEGRLVLQTLFTEESLGEGERAVSRYFGLDGRRSIEKALAKVRRIGKN